MGIRFGGGGKQDSGGTAAAAAASDGMGKNDLWSIIESAVFSFWTMSAPVAEASGACNWEKGSILGIGCRG